MDDIITMDFETYSEAGYLFDWSKAAWVGKGIRDVGGAAYAEHPSTDLISLAADLMDGCPVRLWTPYTGIDVLHPLFNAIQSGARVEAHNSMFEYKIWLHICHQRLGWPDLPAEQLRCSASKCVAWGLPPSLDAAGNALGLNVLKDKRGKQLIQQLSIPKKLTKKEPYLRRTPETHPKEFREMYAYNIQDVRSEHALSKAAPDLDPRELAVWQMDQRINARGVQVDIEAVDHFIRIIEETTEYWTGELVRVTGIAGITAGSTQQLRGWAASQGYPMESVDKDHVKAALKDPACPPLVQEALGIRQKLGAASVKKLYAIKRMTSADGRLRNTFRYHAARTGRWSNTGAQLHNMKNSGPEGWKCPVCGTHHTASPVCPTCGAPAAPDTAEEWNVDLMNACIESAATSDMWSFQKQWGDPFSVIGSCIRGLFIVAPSNDMISSDYSAIEARVLAALAGEEWRLEVFRTHGKIYEMSASKLTGVPFEEMLEYKKKNGKHHPYRKKGKVMELALGYRGWVNALIQFGADKFMSEKEMSDAALAWRKASPAIVELWGGQYRKSPVTRRWEPSYYGLEGCAIQAVLSPGRVYRYRDITYIMEGNVLYACLPSGRRMAYHQPRLEPRTNQYRGYQEYQLSFMGWNTNTQAGPTGWVRLYTHGGRLTENVVQAVSRDILAGAMLRLEAAGYPVILHVHDEPASEVPQGFGSVEEYERIMAEREPWFADWPIKADGGWRGHRYRK